MARGRKPKRKTKTLAQRVTALENAIKPKRARKPKASAAPAAVVESGPQYLGAYRL